MNSYNALFNLEHKTVVVTGAAGILGSELCNALCALGAQVACVDVQAGSLEQLVQNLQVQHGTDKAMSLTCDVANPGSVSEVIDTVIQRYSKIDVLFNNAATKTNDLNAFFEPFSDYALDTWREIMSVNLDGMFLMAQSVGKHMVQAKQGSIVQTASMYSLMGPDQRIYDGSSYLNRTINTPAAYTASKAGVIGLTKHLATLWGDCNIRVNAICPGGVSSGQNEVFVEKYINRVPLGRMANPLDIIGPMLFLASDASSYVTGQVLFADGGVSAW